jgi:AbrB family looped-hinge helix DNA binding protein
MKTSTMTVKGQVTVPKEVRDAFGWRPGDEVAFLVEKDGARIVRADSRRKGEAVIAALRRARWRPGLTTDRLMTLTRGGKR